MIFLDAHGTTPVDERVLRAMLPYFRDNFANPASVYSAMGRLAAEAVVQARQQVAELLGADPGEIVFTSGATEANNLALLGAASAFGPTGHIITQATEHASVLRVCTELEGRGYALTVLPVDDQGFVNRRDFLAALRADTFLTTIMHCNNEVGTVQPIGELGAICRERGILFHTDATQSASWADLDVPTLHVDMLTVSGHKMYGPKGIGALYVRGLAEKPCLRQIMFGSASHEFGLRPGTLNVPSIVGLGVSAALAQDERTSRTTWMRQLRDRLHDGLIRHLPDLVVNGPRCGSRPDDALRHPGNLHMGLKDADGESWLMLMPEVAVSWGAACSGAELRMSHVLAAMGVDPALAVGALRMGVGKDTTEEEIDAAIEQIAAAAVKARGG